MRAEIVEQGAVGDRDSVREAGRAARILEISDVVAARQGKLGGRGLDLGERFPGAARDSKLGGGVSGEIGKLFRVEEQGRVAASEHDLQLVDIGLASAEAGRERQRNRPQPGVDRAEESGGELGAGLGDQCEAVAGLQPEGDEAAGVGERLGAKLGIRISARQRSAGVVEIEAAAPLRGIIERFAKGLEVGNPARLVIGCRSCPGRGEAGCDR